MKVTAELVRQAKAGDANAWASLYDSTYPVAFGVAMQLIKNKDTVEDILQDSYISAFTKLDTLEDEDKFQHWFNRIVANNCKNYLVKKKPELFSQKAKVNDEGEIIEFDIEDDRAEYQPDNAVMTNEIKELFYEMLDKLPEEQKACVLMCWVQDLTIAETAEILGVSENTVKSRLHYAKKKLTGEAEELKKKGVTVFSVGGFALIPFLRWLFAKGSGVVASPQAASGVIQMCKAAASPVATAVTTAQNAANAGAVAANTAQVVAGQGAKAGIKHLGLKIGAGLVSAALVTTGTVAGVTTTSSVKIEDYIVDTIVCEGINGYGSIDEDDVQLINIEELEKALCGNDIDKYNEFCRRTGDSIEDFIDVDIDFDDADDDHLSNGDVAECSITIDYDEINDMDGVKKNLKGKEKYEFECSVSGLQEVVEIDIFATISILGIKTFSVDNMSDYYPLSLSFVNDENTLDFGVCKLSWGALVYNEIRYTVEYQDKDGETKTEEFVLTFHPPKGSKYISGDPITAEIDISPDEFKEYGFVFKETKKEITVDRVYKLMKNTNISDESFNILKTRAEEKAGDNLVYKKAFAAYNETGYASYLVFVFESTTTGKTYGYYYVNFPIDQNGDVQNPENMSPELWEEFLHGTDFSSEEALKQSMLDWVDTVEDIEK